MKNSVAAFSFPSSPQAVFLYFIINVLWVVATFFLQAIGSDVISIKIPKYYSNGTESGEFLKVGTNTYRHFYIHVLQRHR